jgi:hypothetical protein
MEYNRGMKHDKFTAFPEVGIWQRVIEFDGPLSAAAARALLKLQFSAQDHERMRALSAKVRTGTLTSAEHRLIDTYERLGCLLDILHSKARRALKARTAC